MIRLLLQLLLFMCAIQAGAQELTINRQSFRDAQTLGPKDLEQPYTAGAPFPARLRGIWSDKLALEGTYKGKWCLSASYRSNCSSVGVELALRSSELHLQQVSSVDGATTIALDRNHRPILSGNGSIGYLSLDYALIMEQEYRGVYLKDPVEVDVEYLLTKGGCPSETARGVNRALQPSRSEE